MKKIFTSILLILLLTACGDNNSKNNIETSKSKTSKMDKEIKDYLTKDMGDPSSYSGVSTIKVSDSTNFTLFKHKYRAKNKYNALELTTSYVFYDKRENKIFVVLPIAIFTGYKDVLEYGKNGGNYVNEAFDILFTSAGLHLLSLEIALKRKDATLITIPNKVHTLDTRSYEKMQNSMKQSPMGSIGSLVLSMMRIAPNVTTDAILDSWKQL